MPRLSIVVPTNELDERGIDCLDYLLSEANKQTFRDFEIIISDSSADNKISEYMGKYLANATIINYIIKNKKELTSCDLITKKDNIKKYIESDKDFLVDIISKLETTKYISKDREELLKYVDDIKYLICDYLYNHYKNIPIFDAVYSKIEKCNLAKRLNNGMKLANGDIIQILGQNSYFVNKECLQKLVTNFQREKHWMLSPYWHTRDRYGLFRKHLPKLNPNLYIENTIGALSTLIMNKEDALEFDESLICYVDCEYYYRLFMKFGLPNVLNYPITVQFVWDARPNADDPTPEIEKAEREKLMGMYSNKVVMSNG